ncbi:MAG: integrin alpha [candidate division KSB1 bacterium]|nr:integrin alpha [candidate division KSB1 bacterium]
MSVIHVCHCYLHLSQTNYFLEEFPEDIRISNFVDGIFGSSLAVGDVNGDGWQDIISGAYTVGERYLAEGAVFIVFGRPNWPRFIDLEDYPYRTMLREQ